MNGIQQLEMLSESISNEIEELESLLQNGEKYLLKAKSKSFINTLGNIISNLTSVNDSIYSVFENADNGEQEKQENEIMREIIGEKLSYEEKTELRIKHNIDIDWRY